MDDFILRDVTVINPDGRWEHAYVHVKNGVIAAVGDDQGVRAAGTPETVEIETGADEVLVPGMIDVHIHGTNNADVMDGTPEALRNISETLPSEGTTSFLATTITQHNDAITRALENAAAFPADQPEAGAEMLGVHLEGPFFTAEKAGAQPKEHLQKADPALFQQWQEAADGLIKWVSLAPEQDPDHALIRYLSQCGIVTAAAHSDAGLEEVDQAAVDGVSHVTHLFNGMSGLHHRDPGLASAALLNKRLTTEVIADGVHVHPAMVNMAFRLKGAADMLLITDSIRAKCLQNGTYDLGGQSVTVEGNRPYLEDGTIAGSMLKMNEALRNMMDFTGCTLEEAVAVTSKNAAAKLGLTRKGTLHPGMDADMVLLKRNGDVSRTWCRGTLAYQQEGTAWKS
ncbi:N-acetylglucosamine-6-phosphate deacetylase [Salibacterium qingdaonense]|uniref:N-acetylglucosamine-6-phosphate deacetylase n=1 Tax=Salibacterium qingdaonense TaxID=266892 RepID=A0A1I4P029_9BACI|nr:N-acetylglucosamine-6-phosphate deacetylase [Salibacterium qingdaonense]SFM21089.1 N-acetylglucosamine 6-phosphate deacetylase [Salibacterium qingdaonense]